MEALNRSTESLRVHLASPPACGDFYSWKRECLQKIRMVVRARDDAEVAIDELGPGEESLGDTLIQAMTNAMKLVDKARKQARSVERDVEKEERIGLLEERTGNGREGQSGGGDGTNAKLMREITEGLGRTNTMLKSEVERSDATGAVVGDSSRRLRKVRDLHVGYGDVLGEGVGALRAVRSKEQTWNALFLLSVIAFLIICGGTMFNLSKRSNIFTFVVRPVARSAMAVGHVTRKVISSTCYIIGKVRLAKDEDSRTKRHIYTNSELVDQDRESDRRKHSGPGREGDEGELVQEKEQLSRIKKNGEKEEELSKPDHLNYDRKARISTDRGKLGKVTTDEMKENDLKVSSQPEGDEGAGILEESHQSRSDPAELNRQPDQESVGQLGVDPENKQAKSDKLEDILRRPTTTATCSGGSCTSTVNLLERNNNKDQETAPEFLGAKRRRFREQDEEPVTVSQDETENRKRQIAESPSSREEEEHSCQAKLKGEVDLLPEHRGRLNECKDNAGTHTESSRYERRGAKCIMDFLIPKTSRMSCPMTST